MKKPKKRNDEDLNFWQPTSDLMSGLVYILMLVIVLLGLYLMQIPEFDQPDPDIGDTFASPSPSTTEGGIDGDNIGGSEGDGAETPHPTYGEPYGTLTPSPTPSPTPVPYRNGSGGGGGGGDRGDDEEPEETMKAAVHVMLVDAETERTIKEANVQFELYGDNHSLQVLNVYYPERIAFRTYETTEAGTFYLPEKLSAGTYELHELTEPEGYDVSENISFRLYEEYDWPDPYVVRVPLYPSQNIIRVQMTDIETGAKIPGGSFDIIAAENIVTLDGTLRYRFGQTVGTIVCDETGYGESEEIYLGNYTLRQSDIPEYYASYTEDVDVEVSKKSSVPPAINYFPSERTRISITVMDELYESRVITSAEFNIIPSRGLPYTAASDHLGKIRIEDIDKSTSYRIKQTASSSNYQVNQTEFTVNVTADGRISGEASVDVNVPNRLIRVSIGITDEFSKIQIPGAEMSLYNVANELIHAWTTSGVAQSFTDLSPGSYYIIAKNDGAESRYEITVRDQAELQEFNILSSYLLHYLLYAAVALVVILVAVIVLILAWRKKKKKAKQSGKG